MIAIGSVSGARPYDADQVGGSPSAPTAWHIVEGRNPIAGPEVDMRFVRPSLCFLPAILLSIPTAASGQETIFVDGFEIGDARFTNQRFDQSGYPTGGDEWVERREGRTDEGRHYRHRM